MDAYTSVQYKYTNLVFVIVKYVKYLVGAQLMLESNDCLSTRSLESGCEEEISFNVVVINFRSTTKPVCCISSHARWGWRSLTSETREEVLTGAAKICSMRTGKMMIWRLKISSWSLQDLVRMTRKTKSLVNSRVVQLSCRYTCSMSHWRFRLKKWAWKTKFKQLKGF